MVRGQRQRDTVVRNCKNLPKIKLKKFVKLIDHPNAHNSLTNFEYQVNKMTGNGDYVKMLKFLLGKIIREITSVEFIFGGF